jgi:hypothetical protein
MGEIDNMTELKPSPTARIEKKIADLEQRLDVLYHDDTSGNATTGPYFTALRATRLALDAAYREQAKITKGGG